MKKHPLCDLFPEMPDADYKMLVMDIKHNGQALPITLYDGEILDGWHRWRACNECGAEPITQEYDGIDPLSYVLSMNKFRRHIAVGQMAAIISAAQNWELSFDHGGDRRSDQSAVLHFDTVADRSERSGASVRTQKQADKVAKADPELIKRVAKGETTLAKAAEIVTGKIRANSQPEPPPLGEHDDFEVEQLHDALDAVREENKKLTDRLAVAAMDATDEEKRLAAITLAGLREEVRQLQINLHAVTNSRDALLTENAELKKQIKYYQKQIKKQS